ncbi:hypothetical protein [Nesterenkonia rhizosphaerae]|uniref:Uncharacterized protein n=1 Tax=Nesterenkonia rhizosphaerae TaxID=1348272 RepID=A0ABP9FSJ6_9MICC
MTSVSPEMGGWQIVSVTRNARDLETPEAEAHTLGRLVTDVLLCAHRRGATVELSTLRVHRGKVEGAINEGTPFLRAEAYATTPTEVPHGHHE